MGPVRHSGRFGVLALIVALFSCESPSTTGVDASDSVSIPSHWGSCPDGVFIDGGDLSPVITESNWIELGNEAAEEAFEAGTPRERGALELSVNKAISITEGETAPKEVILHAIVQPVTVEALKTGADLWIGFLRGYEPSPATATSVVVAVFPESDQLAVLVPCLGKTLTESILNASSGYGATRAVNFLRRSVAADSEERRYLLIQLDG